jgi:hypothetical protein
VEGLPCTLSRKLTIDQLKGLGLLIYIFFLEFNLEEVKKRENITLAPIATSK